MVRLIRKYEDREYKTEAKQVGTLYHVCTLSALTKYIIPENQLSASGKYHNDLLDTDEAVSFTRDSLFVVPTWTVSDSDILFQFVVDGDKLSEHYKITPFSYYKGTPKQSEKEEVVIGPIKNFNSYIKEVHFDIKTLDPKILSELIEPLKKVEAYLGSIPCKRKQLPFLQEDWTINYKKTAKEFDLYKIKTLSDLIAYAENMVDTKFNAKLLDNIDTLDLFKKYFNMLSPTRLKKLLKKHPDWGNSVNIFKAIDLNNTSLVKLLLEYGADPNIKDEYERSPLYKVCFNDNIELAKLLLEYGADPNIKIKNENIPLLKACSNDNRELVKLLLEYGADLNIKDRWGNSLLSRVCFNDNRELVKLLLEHGADKDINSQNESWMTSLYWACDKNHTEVAKLLLEYGADPNIQDKNGKAPLYLACYNDNIELAKSLIEHGAKVNINDYYGETPLYNACYNNNTELVKLLIEHGADVNIKNEEGYTPLYRACNNENTELIKLLLEHGAWKDLDADNLPKNITRNKEIEELVLSYLNRNKKTESIKIRRLYRL